MSDRTLKIMSGFEKPVLITGAKLEAIEGTRYPLEPVKKTVEDCRFKFGEGGFLGVIKRECESIEKADSNERSASITADFDGDGVADKVVFVDQPSVFQDINKGRFVSGRQIYSLSYSSALDGLNQQIDPRSEADRQQAGRLSPMIQSIMFTDANNDQLPDIIAFLAPDVPLRTDGARGADKIEVAFAFYAIPQTITIPDSSSGAPQASASSNGH